MRVRGLSEATIAKYTRAARLLLKDEAVSSLTADRVRVVMAGTANLQNNTRRSYVNALASLFGFLRRQDLVEALPHVRPTESDRPWWTEAQMRDIVLSVRSDTEARTREYREYFGIMAAVGSRQGETAAIRWAASVRPHRMMYSGSTADVRHVVWTNTLLLFLYTLVFQCLTFGKTS